MVRDGWTAYPVEGLGGLAVALGLLAALALVEYLLVRGGVAVAFAPAIPCRAALPPLVDPPALRGEGAGIRWWTDADGLVRWVGRGGALPRGMRGTAALALDGRGWVHLTVWWTPWWLPLGAAGLLAVVGALRGDGPVAGGLATLVALASLMGMESQSSRAALAVRQALVTGSEAEGGPQRG